VTGNSFEKRKSRFFRFHRGRADAEQEIPVRETSFGRMNEDFGAGAAGPVNGGSAFSRKLLDAHWGIIFFKSKIGWCRAYFAFLPLYFQLPGLKPLAKIITSFCCL